MVTTTAHKLEQAPIDSSSIFLLGSPLIAFFVVHFFTGPGMVWVQLAAIFNGIAEKPLFRKEISRSLSSSDVSSPSSASTRSPSTTSPVTPGAAKSDVAPPVPEGWGGAMEE